MLDTSPKTSGICISYLSHCLGKIPDKSSLKKEKLVLASILGWSPPWKESHGGRGLRQLLTLNLLVAEENAAVLPVFSLLFRQRPQSTE